MNPDDSVLASANLPLAAAFWEAYSKSGRSDYPSLRCPYFFSGTCSSAPALLGILVRSIHIPEGPVD